MTDWVRATDLLPHLLRLRAREAPDKRHFTHVDGATLTYRDSYETSLRWANGLARLGVGRGDNVLSMLPNSFETYHTWLGTSWLGAVEVGLNTAYQGALLEYTINTAQARVMIVSARYLECVEAIADRLPTLETVVVPDAQDVPPRLPQRVVTGDTFLADVEATEPVGGIDPQPWDTCCIIWTSGTTGPSKGVLLPWAEMHTFCGVFTLVLRPDDVVYHCLPAYHVGGKILHYLSVLADLPVVLREAFSPSNFWREVRTHGATYTVLQGPMVRMLLAADPADDDADNPLRALGCAPLPPDLDDFLKRFAIDGAHTYYGMTEIGLPFSSRGFDLPNTASCGRLRDDYEVRNVDEHDYPIPPGEVGELIVRADRPWTMNAGYYGMPEQTAHAWRNGWFHTGDGFRVDDDGNYYFVDRLKDAIRRRGENISSFEVEAYVNAHPAVRESAAIGVPSELGEDEVKIVVVPVEQAGLDPAELVRWLAERMPRFMVPRYVEVADDLPKTEATLRTKKAELRAQGVTARTWDRETAGVVI
jgi:carnitine-CoA ligase